MDNDDQILQEQDRDYKRAEAELDLLIVDLEKRAACDRDTVILNSLLRVRELIKILGVNI